MGPPVPLPFLSSSVAKFAITVASSSIANTTISLVSSERKLNDLNLGSKKQVCVKFLKQCIFLEGQLAILSSFAS